jgi:DNA-binding transcriptional LysR family regulator
MRAFVAVVDAGGFAAAARELGSSRSVLNKQVIKLEDRLGSQLLRRSTRQVSPTEAGRVFYDRCRQILAEVDEAVGALGDARDTPSGNLRINAPMSFGRMHLAPLIVEFMASYPDVFIELVLNDRFVDPIEEGFDLTVRVAGEQVFTSLIARPIAPARRVLCASPRFLEQHGTPRSPADLKRLPCLRYGYQATGTVWRMTGPEGELSVPIHCRMWSNNGEVLRDAAIGHQGIAKLPTFIVGAAMQAGQLVSVLPDYEPTPLTVCALYPRHRHLAAKLLLLVD